MLIDESEFSSFNYHDGSGAALFLQQSEKGTVKISNSEFTKNQAARGAAIYAKGANFTIESSYFVENLAGEVKKEDRINPLNGGALYY